MQYKEKWKVMIRDLCKEVSRESLNKMKEKRKTQYAKSETGGKHLQ